MKILALVTEDPNKRARPILNFWEKYFEINLNIDSPINIEKYLKKPIDILFLWYTDINLFKINFYSKFKEKNPQFKYVIIKDKREETDFKIFKGLVDDIIYLDMTSNVKWKSMAILRRYWDTYSKPSTIIYGDIIADFIEDNIVVNGEKVDLTSKESKLLRYFMDNKKRYISKSKIFTDVWGYEEDVSRTLDQMFFKLKNKVGAHYFHSSRLKGYKFE